MSLDRNSISDLSALVANTGFGSGDTINVEVNPLSSASIDIHIPALQSRGVTVEFDDIVAGVVVEFPDSNLRAVIEEALGKAAGDTITTSDIAALTRLEAKRSNISDLTGFEHAINLSSLDLWDNSISDISSVVGLTNLGWLSLGSNWISDISSLAGLTNLTSLFLEGNNISDISLLAGLTNLTRLSLWGNSISDLLALVANTGLGSEDAINVKVNPLSSVSVDTHIPALQSRGVTVEFDDIVAGVVVEFPDSNLRAVIEKALGKTSGDIITTSDMAALTSLEPRTSNISDLTGLEHAINLGWLSLGSNSISDISSLVGLTNLTSLFLGDNNISDISSLVANTGLGSGDAVYMGRNPLGYLSIHTHIPTLQSRGVTVYFDDQAHPTFLIISGENQRRLPGETLAYPFVVEARDENGSPFAGVSVTFAVTGGGGTLSIHTTTTDANGRAESTLTLGPNFGTNTVFVSAAGIEGLVTFHAIGDNPEFLWSIPSGYSLIHVPLKVTAVDDVPMTIRSIADLYDALGGADTVTYLITLDSQTQEWFVYFRPSDRGTPNDRKLTDDMGIITQLITPVSVRLTGSPLGTNGTSTITLNPVGLTQVSSE